MPSPVTLWLLAVAAGAIGMRRRGPTRPQRQGGGRFGWLTHLAERLPAPAGWVQRAATPALTANLLAAGHADPERPRRVAVLRVVAAEGGAVLTVLLLLTAPAASIIGIALGLVGYALPAVRVAGCARRRRRRIVAELPDLIDAVVLCAEAGMPLEPALRLAAQRLSGPCAEEFRAALAQIDLGEPRRDAYRALADRIGAPPVRGLVGAIVQAEELGTPINETLNRQAELLRAARRQQVRDDAARAAPKVQLVVAMVMVPGALLAVVGVMVLQLIGQLGTLDGGLP